MKFISDQNDTDLGIPTVELTRRNLEALLAKLDDPHSQRTLVCGDGTVAVKAVPDEEHYANRAPGEVYMPSQDRIY